MPTLKTRDSSEIQTWQQCPRQHRYSYIDGLRPVVDRMPLIAGTAAHKCARAIHRGRAFLPILRGWYAEMQTHIGIADEAGVTLGWDQTQLDDEFQGLHAGMAAYEQQYQAEGWAIDEHERKLELRVPGTHTTLVGAIDGLIEIDGSLFVHELKTTRRSWSGVDVAHNRQLAAYTWMARKVISSSIAGVILRVVRLRSPKVKILKSGHPSTSVREQAVPREYLEAAITETGADPAKYAETLAELPTITEYFLQTDTVIYSADAIQNYLDDDLVPVLKLMDRAAASGYQARSSGIFGMNCKGCTYARLCNAEFLGDGTAEDYRRSFSVEPEKHYYLADED